MFKQQLLKEMQFVIDNFRVKKEKQIDEGGDIADETGPNIYPNIRGLWGFLNVILTMCQDKRSIK